MDSPACAEIRYGYGGVSGWRGSLCYGTVVLCLPRAGGMEVVVTGLVSFRSHFLLPDTKK